MCLKLKQVIGDHAIFIGRPHAPIVPSEKLPGKTVCLDDFTQWFWGSSNSKTFDAPVYEQGMCVY